MKFLRHPLTLLVAIACGALLGVYDRQISAYLLSLVPQANIGVQSLALQLEPIGRFVIALLGLLSLPVLFLALMAGGAGVASRGIARRSIARFLGFFACGLAFVLALGIGLGLFAGMHGPADSLSLERMGAIAKAYSEPVAAQQVFLGPLSTLLPGLGVSLVLYVALAGLAIGIAMGLIRREGFKILKELVNAGLEIGQKLVHGLMAIFPLCIMCLLPAMITKTGFQELRAILPFLLVFGAGAAALFIASFIVLWLRSEKANPLKVFRAIIDPLLVALASRSALFALPAALDSMESSFGFARPRLRLALPLGISLGRLGSILFFIIAASYSAALYGVALDPLAISYICAGAFVASLLGPAAGTLTASGFLLAFGWAGLPGEIPLALFVAVGALLEPLVALLDLSASLSIASLVSQASESDKHEQANMEKVEAFQSGLEEASGSTNFSDSFDSLDMPDMPDLPDTESPEEPEASNLADHFSIDDDFNFAGDSALSALRETPSSNPDQEPDYSLYNHRNPTEIEFGFRDFDFEIPKAELEPLEEPTSRNSIEYYAQKPRDRGLLVIAALREDRYPYLFTNQDGEVDGIEAAIAREFARERGLQPLFDRDSRDINELLDKLGSGDADLAIGRLVAPELRDRRVEFSPPYICAKRKGKKESLSIAVSRRSPELITLMPNFITRLNLKGFVAQKARGYKVVGAL